MKTPLKQNDTQKLPKLPVVSWSYDENDHKLQSSGLVKGRKKLTPQENKFCGAECSEYNHFSRFFSSGLKRKVVRPSTTSTSSFLMKKVPSSSKIERAASSIDWSTVHPKHLSDKKERNIPKNLRKKSFKENQKSRPKTAPNSNKRHSYNIEIYQDRTAVTKSPTYNRVVERECATLRRRTEIYAINVIMKTAFQSDFAKYTKKRESEKKNKALPTLK